MSLPVDEFEALLPSGETAFLPYLAEWTVQGRRRPSRSATTSQHDPLPTTADRLLFLLVYLKQQTMHVPFGPDNARVAGASGRLPFPPYQHAQGAIMAETFEVIPIYDILGLP